MTPSHCKKELGQYFTTSSLLQKFVFDKVRHKSHCLLEPSFGAGHLLKLFKEYDDNYPMVCYEIDTTLQPIVSFNHHQTIFYEDFTSHLPATRFKTIVGNPPYVKTKTGNLYIKFIELCYECLEDDGEMIFIVPSVFIKQTRASYLLKKMLAHGSFTDFLFPHNEKLFEDASIDIVAFRYEKGGQQTKTVRVNEKEMYCHVNDGIITFNEETVTDNTFESVFHVYVGLVSGRDKIYQVPFGNIDLLVDKDRLEKYIFPEIFPTEDERINHHLLRNKEELIQRKIKAFNDSNWYKWGAPRNLSNIQKYWGRTCIYLRTLTRHKEVAFIGKVQYFGGSLLCLIPKTDQDDLDHLQKVLQYLNTPLFQSNYLYSGRFKIGHKQISNAPILI